MLCSGGRFCGGFWLNYNYTFCSAGSCCRLSSCSGGRLCGGSGCLKCSFGLEYNCTVWAGASIWFIFIHIWFIRFTWSSRKRR